MISIKDKKIIAFDLDGTLAESKQPLDKEMAILLKELLKHKKVIVISGGSFSQFKKQFLPYLDIKEGEKDLYSNLILLPTSGSLHYLYDKEKSDWLIAGREEMPQEVKEKVFSVINDFNAVMSGNLNPNPLTNDPVGFFQSEINVVQNLSGGERNNLYKLKANTGNPTGGTGDIDVYVTYVEITL